MKNLYKMPRCWGKVTETVTENWCEAYVIALQSPGPTEHTQGSQSPPPDTKGGIIF